MSYERKHFANYYLNDLLASNKQFLQGVDSKKYTQQFMATPHSSSCPDLPSLQEQYIKEKLSFANQSIDLKKERLKLLEINISPERRKFIDYKKKNEYATILDLKSIKPKEPINFINNMDLSFKVNTPTTSGIYGSYYSSVNNTNNFYNKNNI